MNETAEFAYVYTWGNNAKRAELKGRRCRVLARGTSMLSCLLEFEDGERVVSSIRAIRPLTSVEKEQLRIA